MTLEEYADILAAASAKDPLLTESMRRLLTALAFRATEGWTMAQLMGFVAYRKRTAKTPEEKQEAERALRALKTDRWGLRRFCEAAIAEARERQEAEAEAARQAQEERDARVSPRRLFWQEVREKTAQLRGSHRSSGRSRGRKANRPVRRGRRDWAELWRKLAKASRRKRPGASAR